MYHQARVVLYCALLGILSSSALAALTAADREEVVSAHNVLRAAYSLPEVTYSTDLEYAAQKWTDYCQLGSSGMNYGENIYSGIAANMTTALQAWASQAELWTCASNECATGVDGCLFYTQMIWNTSTLVGCGLTECAEQGNLIVCNYEAAGNIVGVPPFDQSACPAVPSVPTSTPVSAPSSAPTATPASAPTSSTPAKTPAKSSSAVQVAFFAPLAFLLLL